MRRMRRGWIDSIVAVSVTTVASFVLVSGYASAGVAGADGAETAKPQAAAAGKQRYLRVVDHEERSVALEIASRTFVHEDEAKPRIALIAVAHIADRSFYDAVAKKMDGYDLVLYEAVAPAGVRQATGESREEKIESTRSAMMFIASLIEQYRKTNSRYPADLNALREFLTTQEPIIRNWFAHALVDPWDRTLVYLKVEPIEAGRPGYELFSLGPPIGGANDANGEANDDPGDRVIRFNRHREVQPMSRDDANLQKQLAEALGLAYQLESLPYEKSNWRISDMTAEELFRAFSGKDVDIDAFAGTLGGTSLPARIVGVMLRMIRMLDAMYDGAISDMVKVLFIEILGDEALIEQSMKQLGGDFAKVLIDQRNQVVIDDLKTVIRDEPEIRSVAILYGAAHMDDIAARLDDQLGYASDEAVWLPAITVDLESSSVDQRQLTQMRTMIRRMMQSGQLRGR